MSIRQTSQYADLLLDHQSDVRQTSQYADLLIDHQSDVRQTSHYADLLADLRPDIRFTINYLESVLLFKPQINSTVQYLEIVTPYYDPADIPPSGSIYEHTDNLEFTQTITYRKAVIFLETINHALNFIDSIFMERDTTSDLKFTVQVTPLAVDTLLPPSPLSIKYVPLNFVDNFSRAFKIIITWDQDRGVITNYFRRYRNEIFIMTDSLGRDWSVKLRHNEREMNPFFRPQEQKFTLEFFGTRI